MCITVLCSYCSDCVEAGGGVFFLGGGVEGQRYRVNPTSLAVSEHGCMTTNRNTSCCPDHSRAHTLRLVNY